MSRYEWEHGSLKIPASSWKELKDAVRSAYNVDAEKRNRATNRTRIFEDEDLYIEFSEDSIKTVQINISENNHARDYAWGTAIGKALRQTLNKIPWTSKTGGILIGNDEYNQDCDYPGGGGNYITCHYGGIGERILKNH